MKTTKEKVISLLEKADVIVNGDRPWDPQIHNDKLYSRLLSQGSLGLGESYMDGWWDCERLDIMFDKILSAELEKHVNPLSLLIPVLQSKLLNLQNIEKSKQVAYEHYDIGNDLYEKMLDKRMVYTCAYWRKAKNLDQAQEDKLDLICKKLKLKKGMTVLDIGCGWGSFVKFAAEKYGVKAVGLTLSKEQAKLARENCKGLPVKILVKDYRYLKDRKFDRVLSIGMFEHVGHKNYNTYFKACYDLLNDDGICFLHTIGHNNFQNAPDPWYHKYIFPNGILPAPEQIIKASKKYFYLEDWENFGHYYTRTLQAWDNNFEKAWPNLKGDKYDERFYRMWRYYLLSSAGFFLSKQIGLWQVVFTKKGAHNYYESLRLS